VCIPELLGAAPLSFVVGQRAMTDFEFWNLIARVDHQADHGDEADAVLPVQAALSGKTEAELVEFQEALAQKLYAIDGEAYAQNAGESGSSADAFLYARLYVVARGVSITRRFAAILSGCPNPSESGASLCYTCTSMPGRLSRGAQCRSGHIPRQSAMKEEAIQTCGPIDRVPHHAADGSQPFRSVTNREPSAAGSRR
jgi:Protein of unknown function (DUF4240)